ncbi:hypothetical protein HFP89_01565 [Wenzhouxiangella sp. XN79A]|uniref:hypothetical protein n=1 Tax=Wenzhouxiangella sp. XN79A TaxID=2724193 RepID=UPI00144A8000|nr:hypothetical protein [Wenzhouxiangella sp. XN79A]NKI33850.1 hypothetical protein [Wenzhouxiangella sp. XN79A]
MNAHSTSLIALGAGAGMIGGWLLANPAAGLVLGAAAGLALDAVTGRHGRDDAPSGR